MKFKILLPSLSGNVDTAHIEKLLTDLNINMEVFKNESGYFVLEGKDKTENNLNKIVKQLHGLKLENGIMMPIKVPDSMVVDKLVVLEKPHSKNKVVTFLKHKGSDDEAVSYKIVTPDSEGIFNIWEDFSQENDQLKVRGGKGSIKGKDHRRPTVQARSNFFRLLDSYYAGIPDLMARMAVPVKCTGAIIGKKGETIRKISRETKAQIHINMQDGSLVSGETIVDITGSLQESGDAMKCILEIVRNELSKTADEESRSQFPLKILSSQNFIGRLVGKDGKNLRFIEKKSGTKVGISNKLNKWSFLKIGDSAVIISGSSQNCTAAGMLVMKKLSSCHKNDTTSQWFRSSKGQPLEHYSDSLDCASLIGGFGAAGAFPNPLNPWSPYAMNDSKSSEVGCCYLHIPTKSVGCIIGSKGHFIKRISWLSGTTMEITEKEGNDLISLIKIKGNFDGRRKAQRCVYERLQERASLTCQVTKNDYECDIEVPSKTIGSLIGKGGFYMRKLQSFTGCKIIIPRRGNLSGDEVVSVKIKGKFFDVQAAEKQIFEVVRRSKSMGHLSDAESYRSM